MSASLWALAGVEADAFAARPSAGGRRLLAVRHLGTRLMMVVALMCYERRVHGSGLSVCLLRPKRWRLVGSCCALTLGSVLVAGSSPAAGAAFAGALVALMAPLAARARPRWKCGWALGLGRGNRLADEINVSGGEAIYVHCVASARPGAGAELLRQLVGEADREHWTLVLDADNERLESYYEQFGFTRAEAPRLGRRLKPGGKLPVRLRRGPVTGSTGSGHDE